jgi:hypothetical protein
VRGLAILLQLAEFLATESCDSRGRQAGTAACPKYRGLSYCAMMFKIMLEKHRMYGYAYANHHTHGANWKYSKAG